MFSSVGMATQEKVFDSESQINTTLAQDTKQLSEVVITSFGRKHEKRVIGFSVAEVQSRKLTQARATNISNSLTAKAVEVRVQAANGMMGTSSSIFVRGMTTFTSSDQPLSVVDGIPIDNGGGSNALQNGVSNSNRAIDTNQNNMESISVLKGPAAAVLHCSRTASGAIIITMKKEAWYEAKKQSVSITSSYNLVQVGRTPDYQNTYGQGNLGIFRLLSNSSWGLAATGQNVTNFRDEQKQLTCNLNNVKDLFKSCYKGSDQLNYRDQSVGRSGR